MAIQHFANFPPKNPSFDARVPMILALGAAASLAGPFVKRQMLQMIDCRQCMGRLTTSTDTSTLA